MRDKILRCCAGVSEPIVCAVSGGGDSVALLHCLWSLREHLGVEITAAHFNHCLRGRDSDEDEAFVRELCAKLQIPLAIGRGDVRALAEEQGLSLEEAARKLRYAFLRKQTGLIALAHHADDQVETVLLNLLRGTGLAGLGGMSPRQGRLLRPMLDVTKEQIEAYLLAHGLSYRHDATNDEDEALRNRLRHHVIPLLRQENPNLSGTVGRMTELLRQDEAYLRAAAKRLIKKAEKDGGYDCAVLSASPLCSRAIRQLLTIPKPSMAHVEAVEALLHSTEGSKSVHLPGMEVRREYDRIFFLKPEMRCVPESVALDLTEPGELQWGSWKISWKQGAEGFAVGVPHLMLRSRKQGDSLQLPGGTKTVKRLLIDRKIPAAKREYLPVFDCGEYIAAVHGIGVDVRCRPKKNEPSWQIIIEERDV